MRKALSILLTAAMATSMLAACGSSTPTATQAPAETKAAETQATTAAEAVAEVTEAAKDAAADGETITVGFAQVGHESDWRTASTNSVQSALSKENGIDLQFVDCDNDSAAQLEAVRNFIQQGVDYIVIDPIVSTGWDTVLTEADDAGIPVIVIDRTIDDSDKYVSWVGSEFTNEGLAAGAWLKAYVADKGISEVNALVISGTTGSSAQIGRSDGFDKYVEAEKWNKIDEQTGDFTQEGGQKVMESYLKSYNGQFNVVVCQNDNEAFGAIDAMKAAGVSYGVDGDVIVISFDACTAGLQKVLAGEINADFQCNPLQGPDCLNIIKKLEAGETVDQKTFMAEPWYVAEDKLTDITYTNNSGKEVTEPLVVVDQAVVDAAY
ncbi:ABC transporter substrate-binding protein [Oribacterium sp. WCC10]|uniref:ABC transporter substrate-binding protein n=1 Tax=Oribacterium sp. WCC10 TaxID=1855343 RepID=UPI0008EB892E|nr:ABC transporter substrate-binding protein [Oribacterium sp. WCC10]SFG30512.1 monosaccharide ABC transporter substrate-binding protein, CUT2 family [Oribacterium sp. WCC10]